MSARDRGSWTRASLDYLDHVKAVIHELEPYWPVTLRQVYYRLVAAQIIDNELGQYKKLSRVLSKARLDEMVEWEALEDRARRRIINTGWENCSDFVSDELDSFMTGYRRDLLQGQSEFLEVWIEKDALSALVDRVASDYCVDVVVARGYSSVSFVREAHDRIMRRWRSYGKQTRLLYFGDMDPSGWNMLPAMMETLQTEMSVGGRVISERCALTVNQIEEYGLPHSPEALKVGDSRSRAYVDRFGELAVELDAIPPDMFMDLVRECIEARLDLTQLEAQRDLESSELSTLDDTKNRIHELLESEGVL